MYAALCGVQLLGEFQWCSLMGEFQWCSPLGEFQWCSLLGEFQWCNHIAKHWDKSRTWPSTVSTAPTI